MAFYANLITVRRGPRAVGLDFAGSIYIGMT